MNNQTHTLTISDQLREIYDGLSEYPRRLPSKLFYDERGSNLFDQICELDEYYPTRTEISIIRENILEIKSVFNKNDLLVELGSGSSIKTELLLCGLKQISGYVPIDISPTFLLHSMLRLKSRYPWLEVYPLCTDYSHDFNIPQINGGYNKIVGFYPGSTLGNFTKDEARRFLEHIAEKLGKNCSLLIGIDLKKDKRILEPAYNDSKGVTAAFNLNILSHLNNEYRANFNINNFTHNAFYNEAEGRIEMHLISGEDQLIAIEDNEFFFHKDEIIVTEYSYKYSLNDFKELVSDLFTVEKVWTDKNKLFSIQYLTRKS